MQDVISTSPRTSPSIRNLTYKIADHHLRVEALDAWSACLAEGFLAGFHLSPVAPPPASRRFSRIKISSESAVPRVPPGLQSFAVAHGHCLTDGERFFLDIDGSLIAVGQSSVNLIEVWFGHSARARHPIPLVNVISYALQAALRRCGLYDLHAACVVERESGTGILLAGTSGSGKSTLTLQLAASGWRYLTDDMIVLSEQAKAIVAHGLRRLFAIGEKTIRATSGLSGLTAALGTPAASDPSKRRLEPTALFPHGFAPSCVPSKLCFPVITNEAVSRSERLAPAAAMARLIKLCPWASYDFQVAPDYLGVLSRVVKQCESSILFAGRDVLDQPARAARLLSSLS